MPTSPERRFADLPLSGISLNHEQVEDVQRNVPPKDLGELAIVFVKGSDLFRFDVVDTDHFVKEHQRDGQRTLGVLQPQHVPRVFFGVVADIDRPVAAT